MKSLSDLRKMSTQALQSANENATVEYEVKTNIDVHGVYFRNLCNAYEYVSAILSEQTDIEFLECKGFEKIDCIQVAIHFIGIDEDNILLVEYTRKSDTQFVEILLT